jgi:hypothetical protein
MSSITTSPDRTESENTGADKTTGITRRGVLKGVLGVLGTSLIPGCNKGNTSINLSGLFTNSVDSDTERDLKSKESEKRYFQEQLAAKKQLEVDIHNAEQTLFGRELLQFTEASRKFKPLADFLQRNPKITRRINRKISANKSFFEHVKVDSDFGIDFHFETKGSEIGTLRIVVLYKGKQFDGVKKGKRYPVLEYFEYRRGGNMDKHYIQIDANTSLPRSLNVVDENYDPNADSFVRFDDPYCIVQQKAHIPSCYGTPEETNFTASLGTVTKVPSYPNETGNIKNLFQKILRLWRKRENYLENFADQWLDRPNAYDIADSNAKEKLYRFRAAQLGENLPPEISQLSRMFKF